MGAVGRSTGDFWDNLPESDLPTQTIFPADFQVFVASKLIPVPGQTPESIAFAGIQGRFALLAKPPLVPLILQADEMLKKGRIPFSPTARIGVLALSELPILAPTQSTSTVNTPVHSTTGSAPDLSDIEIDSKRPAELTPEDQEVAKKQKRKINKILAKESRDRKKKAFEDTQIRIAQLEKENAILKAQIASKAPHKLAFLSFEIVPQSTKVISDIWHQSSISVSTVHSTTGSTSDLSTLEPPPERPAELTPEEQKAAKLRRLLKNRISAQRSRDKKKKAFEDATARIAQLEEYQQRLTDALAQA